MIKVAILTVSDSCSKGQREDISGQTIRDVLGGDRFEICGYNVAADEHESITRELVNFADVMKADIVLTTGGTGLGPRDVTPEATVAICQKMVPGLAETMRLEGLQKSRNAILSRAVAGIRGNTLIVNLPGSPKGVKELFLAFWTMPLI
jgi:molybdenum cofactor synthesis domain-containing protein